MALNNLKVGDTFQEGNCIYEVTAVIPGGYNAKCIKVELDGGYAYEQAMAQKPEPVKEEPKKVEEPAKEEAPAQLDSFNTYTKTEINRLNNIELEAVCKKLGLEPDTGVAMKKAIIAKLGL